MRHLSIVTFFILSLLAGAQAQTVAPRLAPPCVAPCTQQQLLNDVQTQFADNTSGAITPAILRTFQNNIINSMMATSPLIDGGFSCYVGTTGLPGPCTAALGIAGGGTGATTRPAAAAAIFPAPVRTGDIAYWNGSAWATIPGNNTTTGLLQQTNTGISSWVSGGSISGIVLPTPTRAGDVVYWNGSAWLTLPGNNTGTQFLSETAAGIPSWATAAQFPTPTRAGDVMYWNGTIWTTLAGNNTGTQFLQENSIGVPVWAAVVAVTSVTCGTGLAGGTITTTGTCAVQLSTLANSLGADVALNNIANYFDGPSVAQGTTGQWFASGTVTLVDTAAATFYCKLWDGTTVSASAAANGAAAANVVISLSGYLNNPAANIKISCRDISNTTGNIKFNVSGNSKDSTLSVFRVQ